MDRGNGSNFPKILNQKYDIVVGPASYETIAQNMSPPSHVSTLRRARKVFLNVSKCPLIAPEC